MERRPTGDPVNHLRALSPFFWLDALVTIGVLATGFALGATLPPEVSERLIARIQGAPDDDEPAP